MIRFDHVSQIYRGTKKPALNRVDLEILRGEFVFLVGASGSGKSSFLRLVLKEDKPTSGSIHVLGQDLGTISSRKVPYFRRNLGVVFQDFRLLPNKNVFDNVAFTLQVIGKSRGFIQEAVPDVLAMVGLNEKANRLPHELSGGEQQRVAIARAVVNKPAILLADEPTGNLDPLTSGGIMQVLQRINAGGTTVIMATHDNAIVDQMQRRVIELVQGEVVRDELEGGYGMTAEIALRDSGMTAEIGIPGMVRGSRGMGSSTPTFSAPVVTAEPSSTSEAPVAPAQAPAAQAPDQGEPAVAAPAAPVPAASAPPAPLSATPRAVDPVTDQLGLAEKLGLRAPGERIDPAKDQNVGPTS
ncbi:cell division ATP-binding protein FtsE [Agreia pratensis]|uniref:Cell division ATP-binding protein FtsE n=1 Tax=Agreia pratensis TaxID=150121 RepID=A0A1X7K4H0_9MICO|nr:cell division ATP-binding protein FtsE [Agreia pratensis]MBF4634449.1 cell division ATP-binding protein FtsE [Agreia pratensis]SMG35118.1 cell division transport system ATP-binding protein [Agreia pratensis]